MNRVGKSATETEAETWESNLITVLSCAYMTGCFGRTRVFLIFRLNISYNSVLFVTLCSTSQGHSSNNEAALNKYLRVCSASGKQACLVAFRSCLVNCYCFNSALIQKPLCAPPPTGSKNAFISPRGCYYLHVYPTITAFWYDSDKKGWV